ncbi:PP2C family protein-serine/threonine phosphatase [Escherichia coli]|uniref:PP2C family protein-serine/threonine phosphatase n=1 Tax=Escherichia coli TaxID=562 RepID=UPI0019C83DBC|nr:protein phosphatase 2C domain-containing protein [Escherichia coli]HAL0801476.1 serine/threonine-protein phosphatase [Escherichia coli RS218]HBN7112029.1 protein phosphatase 2C domain-containing protein [Escherichia coli]
MINLLSCGFFSCPKDSVRGNQDSYVLPTPTGKGFLFAVADGVGSYEGAKEIADTATSALRSFKHDNFKDIQKTFLALKEKVDAVVVAKSEWINAATTLSFCFVDNEALYVGHVGDTRVYVKKGAKLQLITKDHTQHQELFDDGIYTKKELRDLPGKNTLTSAISRNIALRFQSVTLPLSELVDENGLITVYIMSDGAHHFWEQRPRLSLETISKAPKFAASLLRRIERSGPIDDYTLVAVSFQTSK